MRSILFMLLFLPLVAFGQALDGIDVQILDQSKDYISKNGRMELGFTLPDSILNKIEIYLNGKPFRRIGLNPFVSWDVDIRAVFTHKTTGKTVPSIGFWYQDFTRDKAKNSWDALATPLPFRVRFSPPETGAWDVNIQVKIQGEPYYQSQTIDFTVVDSEYKGNVTYNAQKGLLERDGVPFYPLGINLPSPSNKNNLTYSLDKDEELHLSAWTEYRQQVKDYISKGGEYFRMFLQPSSTDIEFEEVGNYQKRQNFAWEMDQLIALCEANNTLINFNLMYHTLFMKLGDYYQFRYDYTNYWYDENNPQATDPNPPSGYAKLLISTTPSDMFLKPLGIKYMKEKVRYIMARWGYSTCLSTIELMSEPWHINQNSYRGENPYDEVSALGDTARKAVYNYHKVISNYIKDSLGYRQHLLSAVGRLPVGAKDIYSHLTETTPNFVDSTWYLKNIDVISLSYYTASPEKLLVSKSGKNNEYDERENSVAHSIERLKETYHKPVLFGESDDGDDTYMCSDYEGHYLNAMRYPFTGAIGHYLWATFIHEDPIRKGANARNESHTWSNIVHLKDDLNQAWYIDVFEGDIVYGREKSDIEKSKSERIEQQYIIAASGKYAAGYVYNRTYNVSTAAGKSADELVNTNCWIANEIYSVSAVMTWSPQKMYVDKMKRSTRYRLRFYNYKTGDFLSSMILKSSLFGKVKLMHPALTPTKDGRPLLWYTLEQVD